MFAVRFRRGFTLIELLLVIGVIAILASIVIVAINPTKQLGSARDAQRHADALTIMNAIYQYTIDNSGKLPGNLSGSKLAVGTAYNICLDGNTARCTNYTGIAIFAKSVTGSYVTKLPQDPLLTSTGTGYTGYQITLLSNGRIQISAPKAEQTSGGISVQR